MPVPALGSRMLRFGPFELNVASGELRKSGITLRLRPQAARILAFLATRPGEIIRRDQLREEIWGRDVFVDYEHGLNLCIREIRAALDDDAVALAVGEEIALIKPDAGNDGAERRLAAECGTSEGGSTGGAAGEKRASGHCVIHGR